MQKVKITKKLQDWIDKAQRRGTVMYTRNGHPFLAVSKKSARARAKKLK